MSLVFFITHPDVVIDPDVPVPDWPLSAIGRARMELLAAAPFVGSLRALATSAERKALDGAEILARASGLSIDVEESLGENDRSATGYLPATEFTRLADEFFAQPDDSVQGWETARAAQARVHAAVDEVLARSPPGDVAVVSHGGVGTLLLCALAGTPISRRHDQPGTAGGCLFSFERDSRRVVRRWQTFEEFSA